MKQTRLYFIFLFFAHAATASVVESFNNISVNPQGTYSHKVVSSVHVVTDFPLSAIEDKLAVREAIAIALSSLTIKELTKEGGITLAKYQLLKQLKSTDNVDGMNIKNVYITDLVVSFIGANRATVYVEPKEKRN